MLFHKQRFICKSCHSTFCVTTSLNKPNRTLSCKLKKSKHQNMLLTKEGLNNELIAHIRLKTNLILFNECLSFFMYIDIIYLNKSGRLGLFPSILTNFFKFRHANVSPTLAF